MNATSSGVVFICFLMSLIGISCTDTGGSVSNEENSVIVPSVPDSNNKTIITVESEERHQYVTGFGGMYNPKIWCGSFLITMDEMKHMYSPDELGYTIMRMMVYPKEKDWEADVEAALYAQEKGATLFASSWNCTDVLADSIVRQSDGKKVKHLKHENYAAYARHLIRYVNYMKGKGVYLYALSVQNEPDMSFTYWTPAEITDFVKRYGSVIRKETGVKPIAPEACGSQPSYTDAIVNEPEAFDNTDIIGGHFYQGFLDGGKRYDYVAGLYDRLNDRPFWMTEHLFNEGIDKDSPDEWKFGQWSYCLFHLAKEISMAMEAGCSAYVYWYLKRAYGMVGDNDPKAPVRESEITKNGYILSHFARYASGCYRVNAFSGQKDILATAYVSTSGSELSVVLLNLGDKNCNICIPVENARNASAVMTSETVNMHRIITKMSGNGTEFVLPAKSIVSVKINKEIR